MAQQQQTLAQMVRAKYPGAYDDLSDADLEKAVSEKYPGVYDDIPRTGTAQRTPTHPMAEFGYGVAKGAARTVIGAAELGNKLLSTVGLANRISPNVFEAARADLATPTSAGQKLGMGMETVAELAIPYGGQARAAQLATKIIPKAASFGGRVIGGLMRAGGEAAEFGAKTALQTGGDPGEVATSAALGAATVPVSGAARALLNRRARAATVARLTPDETAAVPMTASERGGGKIPKFLERVTERTVPGSGVFERFREQQQTALQGLADDIVQRVSTTTGTAEEVGMTVQRSLDDAKKAIGARIGEQFDEIDRLTGGLKVSTEPLKRSVAPMLRRLQEESKLIPPDILSQTRAMLERVMQAPKALSFRAFQDARSDLVGISQNFTEAIPGRSAGLAKVLTKATDDAMMKAAESSGIPGLVDKFRAANASWRTFKDTFNDTVIKKLITAAPEKVSGYVQSAELADIRRLASTISPETMNQVRATLLRDMLNKSTAGELGRPGGLLEQAGVTLHGRAPVRPATLGGKQLRSQMEKLGEAKLKTLFGDQTSRDLIKIADLAERIGPKAEGMAPGLIAGGINSALFSPILSPAGWNVLTLPQAAMTAGSFNMLARILVKQPSQRVAYRQFLSALERGKPQQALAYGIMLSRAIDRAEAGEKK